MTQYVSTRGARPASLADALLRGLAPDGGLYLPATAPDLRSVGGWSAIRGADSFRAMAAVATEAMVPGLAPDTARAVSTRAANFSIPLVHLEANRYVLELHHGPSHAFKDVGARFMAGLVSRLADPADGPLTVLVATSGDTGGAVAHAFHRAENVRVVILFPTSGVTGLQRKQITTLGDNVLAVSVDGTFDDCQRLVKEAFSDRDLSSGARLTSANSINVGRLLPQTLYYLLAAALASRVSERAPHFVVPSGNLGNLCAGLIAHRAGMPCNGFVAASNANRGFVDFLHGRPFEARASVPTPSNAMDVGAPSNLERIRWLFDGDDAGVRDAIRGEWVSDDETLTALRAIRDRTGYLPDPHTAVGLVAAERLPIEDRPVIVLSTAHPAKFSQLVERATGESPEPPPGLRLPNGVEERVVGVGPDIEELRPILLGEAHG